MAEKCCGVSGGWKKNPHSPVLGGAYGTCFDISMLHEEGLYKMYFSWRDRKSIAFTASPDGVHWSEPTECIRWRETERQWENNINRPSVVRHGGVYHMWYTGQYQRSEREGASHIFYAQSCDGVHFERVRDQPVLGPDCGWEQTSTMNPSVLWDEQAQQYRMWYCAGAQYEPRAIGYAQSRDGIHWHKDAANPVFEADPANSWEQHKTAGCQIIRRENDYLMFYIGYFDEDYAQIGMAKSPDGRTNWVRYEKNPIIAPDAGAWDADACYKPFAMLDGDRWLLWYNGRLAHKEQIGLAVHEGAELGF